MSEAQEIFTSTLIKCEQLHRLSIENKKYASMKIMGSSVTVDFTDADYITINTLSHLKTKDLKFVEFSSGDRCYVSTLEGDDLKLHRKYGLDTWSVSSKYIVFKDKQMKELVHNDNWGGGSFNFTKDEVLGKTIAIKSPESQDVIYGFITSESSRNGNDGGQGGSWKNVDYIYQLESDSFDRNTKLLDLLNRGFKVFLKGE